MLVNGQANEIYEHTHDFKRIRYHKEIDTDFQLSIDNKYYLSSEEIKSQVDNEICIGESEFAFSLKNNKSKLIKMDSLNIVVSKETWKNGLLVPVSYLTFWLR